MSLINEALKKAQRQRTLDAAPLSSAPSGVAAAAVTTHVPAASRSRRRNQSPIWFGLGLLVLGAGATALIMRYGFVSAPTAAASPAQQPFTVATPAAEPASALESAPVPVAEIPSIVLPSLVPIPLAPVNVTPVAPPPTEVLPLPDVTTPAEQAARVYAFLDTIRLTGVRGVDNQARVLMNERVYRLNEVVDVALGLRISAVSPGLLVFTDATGQTYEKPY